MTNWAPQFLQGSDLVDLHVVQWGPGVTLGDTFVPIARGDLVDRSIQVEGTFGGATINIQGSNDAISTTTGNYHALHDPFNSVIAITQPGVYQVLELTAWMVPAMSGASASTSLTITTCQKP